MRSKVKNKILQTHGRTDKDIYRIDFAKKKLIKNLRPTKFFFVYFATKSVYRVSHNDCPIRCSRHMNGSGKGYKTPRIVIFHLRFCFFLCVYYYFLFLLVMSDSW